MSTAEDNHATPDRPTPTTTRAQHTRTPTPATPHPDAAATRRQHTRTTPTTARQPDPTGAALFPPQLTTHYTPHELVGTGAEGAVWRVSARRTGAEHAVKVHWDNQPMDTDLLAHLDNAAFHRHVPAITDHGRITTSSGTRDWVAMEYLHTNLADLLIETRDAPLPDKEAIVAELAHLIAFWQDVVDRNPLDFKPANILIRDTGTHPGQFVISDFGGIHRFTASQAHGDIHRFNLAYAPPEHTWSEHASPWPWWGLGEIAHELATGHARFRHRDGHLKADAEIVRGQILGDRGTTITDDRWRRLVRGLLTVDPDDRWGATQVHAWLNGHHPPVADDHPTPHPDTAPVITFGRLRLSDPTEIAAHLLDNGGDAAHWLIAEHGATQLADLLDAHTLHPAETERLRAIGTNTDRAHHAVTALGAALTPDLTPTYAGHPVDVDGLVHLAGTDPTLLHHLLTSPATMRTIAAYHCGHPECARLSHCDRIQRLTAEAPQLARDAATDITTLGQTLTTQATDGSAPDWPPPSDTEHDHAHALATLAVLAPDQLRSHLDAHRASALLGPHWWRRQVLSCDTTDSTTGRRAMVTTLLLADRAATDRARTRAQDRPHGRAYASSLWHRVIVGVAAGLALVNAAWAGTGAFDNVGVTLANLLPLIVAAATALAVWPWRTPETAPRLLTATCWLLALIMATTHRPTGVDPPTHARLWWPAPDALTAFMGLLPAPLHLLWWWLQILIAATVAMLAIKLVRLRMRLAYRQRYVHFWDAPRLGATPEERLGLAPLTALAGLGLLAVAATVAAVAADTDDGRTFTLALAAPPLAYLVAYLACGLALLWLPGRARLLLAATAVATTLTTAGFLTPLRLVEIAPLGPMEAVWLLLCGLAMMAGAAAYARTRLSPPRLPRL